jgi:hypothetical protein
MTPLYACKVMLIVVWALQTPQACHKLVLPVFLRGKRTWLMA